MYVPVAQCNLMTGRAIAFLRGKAVWVKCIGPYAEHGHMDVETVALHVSGRQRPPF